MDDFDNLDLNFDFDFDIPALGHDINTVGKETPKNYNDKGKEFLAKWDIRAEKVKKQTMICINNILTDFRLPLPGEQMRIRTQQQINLISIIFKIIQQHKKIEELTIATYTLNKEVFSLLIALLRKKTIEKLNLFLTSAYSFRDKEYYEKLKRNATSLGNNYDFHLVFAWLHFKISLVKCGDNFYQFEGSMNYSMNNMAEQILLENNKETYDYDYNFINKIMIQKENKALEIVC